MKGGISKPARSIGARGFPARLTWLCAGLLALALPALAQIGPNDCLTSARGQVQLVPLRANFHTVSGPLGGFDPCEASVRWRLQPGPAKAPLMISVHGGGGIQDVLKSDDAFHAAGMATLVFDAYAMQGLPGRSSLFWARSVTNEARQRMIYATALAAYEWARRRNDVDTRQIYLFGVSNGAAVVANLAAVVDPAHVRGVIAEGITPIGLGLPDEIRVPVLLAFGRLDDFGSPDPAMMRWDLSDDCRLNVLLESVPAGSARRCNQATPGQRIPTPLQWAQAVRSRGGRLSIVYVDDMAHNAYFGLLRQQRVTWGNGQTLGASLGATDAARERFFQHMRAFIEAHALPR
jgi:dienelactone hydrolase